MSHPPIGIDLGTSTSIITAYIDGKPYPIPDPITKSPIVPSVVGVSETGEILVGQLALDQAVGHVIQEAKRGMGYDNAYPLGGRLYCAEEIAARILSYLKSNAEAYLHTPIDEVVISVPANYEDGRRRAVTRAAALAGMTAVRLINEPTAAAVAYSGASPGKEETILVYDFGGGTLDVTVGAVSNGVLRILTSHGVAELGGKDFDSLIVSAARSEFAARAPEAEPGIQSERALKRATEGAKKALSQTRSAAVQVFAFAQSGGQSHDLRMTLTREQLEAMSGELVAASLAAVDEALQKCGLLRESIDRVLLAGGMTHMPAIRNAVLAHLGDKPWATGCDPDLAVSIGACMSAVAPAETRLEIKDVSTYGIGTRIATKVDGETVYVYEQLMPPNTPLPYSRSFHRYRLLRTDQSTVRMMLLEDVRGNARLAADTVPIGETEPLTDIPPATDGRPHDLHLHFAIDASGVISLRVALPELGMSVSLETSRNAKTGPAPTPDGSGRTDTAWTASPIADEFRMWVARAEERLAQTPRNAAELGNVLARFKVSIAEGDRSRARTVRQQVLECLLET